MIVAVIPAKATSRRCPAKNFRPLGGRPLWQWTYDAASEAKSVDRIVISTDAPDAGMRAVALRDGTTLIERHEILCDDEVPATEVVADALHQLESLGGTDGVAMLLPTSPFRAARHIDRIIEAWQRRSPEPSAVATVTKGEINRTLRRVSPCCGGERKDGKLVLPPEALWVISNGAMQVCSVGYFFTDTPGYWKPGPVYPYVLSAQAGLDIDTEAEWAVALHYAGMEHDEVDRAP